MYRLLQVLFCLSLVLTLAASPCLASTIPHQYGYKVVQEYPHDPGAYTQGLAYDHGTVYEGTGLYGKSSLRQVDLSTGRVERIHDHEQEIFAEGVTVFEDRIFQLTWQNNLIYEFNKDDFALRQTWPFARQGWGVTHDGRHLIVSDGSSSLYYLDPETMEETHAIAVYDNTGPLSQLNELEYINGQIYANIYQQGRIAIIKPDDGSVSGYLDLSGLVNQVRKEKNTGVLNGIMYDSDHDRLFVTGKLWPLIFEIKLMPGTTN